MYLRSFHLSFAQASQGYLSFSLTMVVGRLMGDRFTQRFGRAPLAALGSVVGLLGLTLVMLAVPHGLKILGFALTGAGLSVLAPLAFSAAWHHAEARGIAVMTAIFYGGFLAGPPVTGLVIQQAGKGVTFLLPALFLLMAAFLSRPEVLPTPK